MGLFRVTTRVRVGKYWYVKLGSFAKLRLGWARTFYPFGRPRRRRYH